MMGEVYSREELRRVRAARETNAALPRQQLSLLEQVPPDAPMDDGIVIGFWNGERFVSWEKWRATAPIVVERPAEPSLPSNANCLTADCGDTKVWLVRDGDRWLMYAGSRKAAGKRRDFASPFLEHAIQTAEQWYGAANGRWREERKRDARHSDEDGEDADPHVHGEKSAPLLAPSGRD